MPSLWTPNDRLYPDPENIFDMAYVMQETLVSLPEERRVEHAHYALDALGAYFDRMNEEQRNLSLHSDMAVYPYDDSTVRLLSDIGMRGVLGAIRYVELPGMPVGLSLAVDTYETFTPGDPDARELTTMTLSAPIAAVHYIETAA
jgi:hypothetical protein